MKIFISWSGAKSGSVGEALYDWLPQVIQVLEPWLSATDIEKGARWRTAISTHLEESAFGIVCLTRDNMEAPWLLFESGALSKFQQTSRVCTFLIDLKPTEVREPLAQFQSTRAIMADVFKLIETINKQLGDAALESRKLERAFRLAWPELEQRLKAISKKRRQREPIPDPQATLDEILGHVRTLSREATDEGAIQTGLSSEEIILLGKILSTNRHLNVVKISEAQIHFEDGTHGTLYRINRRALSTFLRRVRKMATEENKAKRAVSSGTEST